MSEDVQSLRLPWLLLAGLTLLLCLVPAQGQSVAAGTIRGKLTDPSGAAIPGAAIVLSNPAQEVRRTVSSGPDGSFQFVNVPFGVFQLSVKESGFAALEQNVAIRGPVPVQLNLRLDLAKSSQTVTVKAAGAMVQSVSPTAQTEVSQAQIAELPQGSPAAGLSSLITYSSPSVVADSNGFFHPLGDHAEQTFVVDGQPNSNQQSKLFSTSIPPNAVQSLNLVTAAPSAEYGDKTSMVVQVTTRSGLAAGRPHGSFDTYYGSFGTAGEDATLGFGNNTVGNFVALDSVRSGRFMDSPEFTSLHDIGNHGVFFDRFDYQSSANDSFHLDIEAARNWFQIPNTYVQNTSAQDQRQQVVTLDLGPSYQHIFGASALLTVNPWIRRDHVQYFPSGDPFNDQPATIRQNRMLTNWGTKVDYTYSDSHQTITAGTQLMQTRLNEEFGLGLTDPLFNAICAGANGAPIAALGISNPAGCGQAGGVANPSFAPGLLPFDLTRGGAIFHFADAKNVNEQAVYVQDGITWGSAVLSAGVRVNHYAGLVSYSGVQPRLGASYHIHRTNTVLRASYSRSLESPYNENLLLSSATGAGGLAANAFGAYAVTPLQPGKRNDFSAGLQQNLGRWVQVDGNYFWKFTHDAFDFDTLFNTPITFPINWNKSKIDGFGVRVSTVSLRGFRLNVTMGHTRARFFGPENGGVIFNSPLAAGAFRIDHDQAFQQNTNVSYRHGNLWTMLTWRFDSGMVAGAVPDLASVLALNGDDQAAMGFYCGTQFATPSQPITACGAPYGQWGATRVRIPAPGTENDDTNPPRIAPRQLFDVSVGDDSLRQFESGRLTLRFSLTNLTNAHALYNFLSTFSGTHFVEPRNAQVTLGFEF